MEPEKSVGGLNGQEIGYFLDQLPDFYMELGFFPDFLN